MNESAATDTEYAENDTEIRRTYRGEFCVTSVFPVLSDEEKIRLSIEITGGLKKLAEQHRRK
jgi:hypothetical protein